VAKRKAANPKTYKSPDTRSSTKEWEKNPLPYLCKDNTRF